ncbi:hypothetical protein PWT90_09232 [Aphanocladium album]|nr:hypothetical protein PWT90_09232 [Aphanocladium album]
MVKITLAAAAFLAATAAANNCKPGIKYCGWNLLRVGRYQDQIQEALRESGVGVNGQTVDNSLFYCLGGDNGEITVDQVCPGRCRDGGADHNDFC